MKEKNKNKKWIIIAVVVLLIFVIGATFAYFQAQQDKYKSSSADLITKTTDSFTFEISNDISINASLSNFSEGTGNLSSSATAKAILRANNYTGNAKYFYNLVIDIASNDFIYTTSSSNPELILTITDPTGKIITSLDGLNYVTSGDVSGFDVTTKTGQILIAENYVISTTSTITQTWNITLTFVNLNSDQQANTGKSFNAKLKMNKENPTLLADHIISLYSEDGVNNLYYHDGMGSYTNSNLEANDNSYRYTGAEATVTSSVCSSVGYCSISSIISSSYDSSTNKYIYTLRDGVSDSEFDNYFKALEQAQKDGYVENLMNNFVCFGSDEEICPDENLYRIIGVFKDGNEYNVKLISADYATEGMLGTSQIYSGLLDNNYYKGKQYSISSYQWGAQGYDMGYDECMHMFSNIDEELLSSDITISCPTDSLYFVYADWDSCYLRRQLFDETYYRNFSSSWQNLIKESQWHTRGMSRNNQDAHYTYRNEIMEEYKRLIFDNSHVTGSNLGLMYISDYMYAALPSYWSELNSNYNSSINDNWLYLGAEEWTITPLHDRADQEEMIRNMSEHNIMEDDRIYIISDNGNIDSSYVKSSSDFLPVRPTFYLSSNVIYLGGSGTASDPMRIK